MTPAQRMNISGPWQPPPPRWPFAVGAALMLALAVVAWVWLIEEAAR